MRQYLKAQYFIPAIIFVFIALYVIFLISGGEVQVQERRSSLSRGGGGYFLFYKLFKQLGYKFKRWYEAEPPKKGGCLFYFDYYPGNMDQKAIDDIAEWVEEGNFLFLVGIHTNIDPILKRQLKYGPAREVEIDRTVTPEALDISFPLCHCIEPGGKDVVLARSESGALVIERLLGSGRVYLFADNKLLVNRYFLNPHHALFLNGILNDYYKENFYVYEYGTRTSVYKVKNPVTVLFKGDFLFLTLHLFLVGMVFVAWKSKRFGKPLQAEPFKRRSISVHLAAVGEFYQKTKAYKIVESLTRKYLIHRARHILNIKKNIPLEELAKMLAKYSSLRPEKIKVLLEEPTGIPERMLVMKRKDIYDLIMEIRDSVRSKK